METKMATNVETLCKGTAEELITLIKYCKALRFDEEPNYNYIRRTMTELFIKNEYKNDYKFDWLNPVLVRFQNNKQNGSKKNPYLSKNEISNIQKQIHGGNKTALRNFKSTPQGKELLHYSDGKCKIYISFQ